MPDIEDQPLLECDIQYALSKFRAARRQLQSADRAMSPLLDDDAIRFSSDPRETLEKVAAEWQHGVNTAEWHMDKALSVALYDSYNAFWASPDMTPEEAFGFHIKDGMVLVHLPPLPTAGYRKYGNTMKDVYPVKYPQLQAWMCTEGIPDLRGEKYLFILHILQEGTRYRKIPDFDNYDTKWLIDTMLRRYGGDACLNYTLFNRAVKDSPLLEGTYLVLGSVDSISQVDLVQLQQVLESVFCPEQMGTAKQRPVDEIRAEYRAEYEAKQLQDQKAPSTNTKSPQMSAPNRIKNSRKTHEIK